MGINEALKISELPPKTTKKAQSVVILKANFVFHCNKWGPLKIPTEKELVLSQGT